jgi:hypothetical protein
MSIVRQTQKSGQTDAKKWPNGRKKVAKKCPLLITLCVKTDAKKWPKMDIGNLYLPARFGAF